MQIITGYNNTTVKPTGDVKILGVLNSNWAEGNITYNNRPSNTQYFIAEKNNVTFDVTSMQGFDVKSNLINYLSYNYYSLMVNTVNINGSLFGQYSGCYLYSKEVGSNYSSRLYIEYTIN